MDSFTEHNNFSYLLAFVQLTWQVGFSPVLDDFFMEFINIGPMYINGWVGGVWGWDGQEWHRDGVGGGKSRPIED